MSRLAVGVALGAGLLIAGCGSSNGAVSAGPSSSSAVSPAVVGVSCGTGRVTVPLHGHLTLRGCAAGVTARADDAKLREIAAGDFEALQVGSSGITLSAGPACSAGTLCPQFVRFVGVISVTVTAA